MQAVLTDLARQERADPHGSVARAAGYAGLASRLHDVCATGRFGHLLGRPTRLPAAGAPLVVLGTASVPPEVAAAVLLSIAEYVQRLAERLPAGRVALLVDALDVAPLHGDAERFPEPFPHDSLLNGLHESYLSRRVRAGEIHAIAYLHAISDVARLHLPTALGAGPLPDGRARSGLLKSSSAVVAVDPCGRAGVWHLFPRIRGRTRHTRTPRGQTVRLALERLIWRPVRRWWAQRRRRAGPSRRPAGRRALAARRPSDRRSRPS